MGSRTNTTDDALDGCRPSGAKAKPTPVGPVVWPRVVAGTIAIVGVAAVVMELVRLLPDGGTASAMVAVALGLAVIPIIASPIEWFVHRFVYHEAVIPPLRAVHTVHTAHHHAYFPTWRYVTAGPPRRLSIRRRAPDARTSRAGKARGERAAHIDVAPTTAG